MGKLQGENKKDIYSLGLNDVLVIDGFCHYRRVPGGWIVSSFAEGKDILGNIQEMVMSSVFVPFHKEFMKDR